MSTFSEHGSLRMTSGAIHATVPANDILVLFSVHSRLVPKSEILTTSFTAISTLQHRKYTHNTSIDIPAKILYNGMPTTSRYLVTSHYSKNLNSMKLILKSHQHVHIEPKWQHFFSFQAHFSSEIFSVITPMILTLTCNLSIQTWPRQHKVCTYEPTWSVQIKAFTS